MAILRFTAPLWGLGTTYDVHLRLTGKRKVDFLLVLIELFWLGVTAEENRRFARGSVRICQIFT